MGFFQLSVGRMKAAFLVLFATSACRSSSAHEARPGGLIGRGIPLSAVFDEPEMKPLFLSASTQKPSVHMSRYKDEVAYSLWPQNYTDGLYYVPYEINETDYTEWERTEIIEWALRNIERGSNIRFPKRTDTDTKWLYINNEVGCAAGVGYDYIESGPHPVHLSSPSCMVRNTAMHEVLHALAFAHEHQRGDAPKHIRIYYGSDPSLFGSLAPSSSIATDSVYDIGSVMHYYYYLRPLNASLYEVQQNRVPTLSSCDWYALNTWYPGPMPAPECKIEEVPDICEPDWDWCDDGEDVCEYNCRWFCVDTFEDSNGTQHWKCKFRGGGEFPVDDMSYITPGTYVPPVTPPNALTTPRPWTGTHSIHVDPFSTPDEKTRPSMPIMLTTEDEKATTKTVPGVETTQATPTKTKTLPVHHSTPSVTTAEKVTTTMRTIPAPPTDADTEVSLQTTSEEELEGEGASSDLITTGESTTPETTTTSSFCNSTKPEDFTTTPESDDTAERSEDAASEPAALTTDSEKTRPEGEVHTKDYTISDEVGPVDLFMEMAVRVGARR